jgi:hypothetical protein
MITEVTKELIVSIAEAGQGIKAEVRRGGVIQDSAQVVLTEGKSVVSGEWQQVRNTLMP